jgi:cation transport ATPase
MSPDLTLTQRQSDEVKLNKNASTTVAQLQVQLPSEGLQIVHATRKRVRVRVSEGALNSRLESISQYLRQQHGIKEVSTNQQTGSIIVTFDENRVSLPQVIELLQQLGIHPLETSAQSTSKTDPFAAWKSLDFWKEQSISFIPLMTGLAVTGGLGINGLAAIPVYMITSGTTRRIIDFARSQILTSEDSENKENQKQQTITPQQSPNLPTSVTYSIVHTLPGRVRFHVPQIAQHRAYARRLERLIKADPQVTSVRVNDDAASITIAYHPHEVSISHWVNLMELALQINPAVEEQGEMREMREMREQEEIKEQKQQQELVNYFLSSSSSHVWAEMKPSALSYSLAYMANFPL